MNLNFRDLTAGEVEARFGQDYSKGITLLLYKDARCDMSILDETVGAMNWQRAHKEIKGNMYAGVGIWDEERAHWVWKWDCGTESRTEKEKGEASDSFKRACVNWGIGRELYTSPLIWIEKSKLNYDDKTGKLKTQFEVTYLECDVNKVITCVVIADRKSREVLFSYGKPRDEKPKKQTADTVTRYEAMNK